MLVSCDRGTVTNVVIIIHTAPAFVENSKYSKIAENFKRFCEGIIFTSAFRQTHEVSELSCAAAAVFHDDESHK